LIWRLGGVAAEPTALGGKSRYKRAGRKGRLRGRFRPQTCLLPCPKTDSYVLGRITNRITRASLPCPIAPTVADHRTRNLLILRVPASERPPVTAEAAGSSPVVPAILSIG